MRTMALVVFRASLYLGLGLVFGTLAFMRSNSYKRRTGNSPWHIHPVVWGGVSAFTALFVTLLSMVFVAIFGTVLSIVAWSPRRHAGRPRGPNEAPEYEDRARYGAGPQLGPTPGPERSPRVTALTAWLPDPTGRNELRYFDGSVWTEHVANAGVISADEFKGPCPPW
jgi:hypothetical protein